MANHFTKTQPFHSTLKGSRTRTKWICANKGAQDSLLPAIYIYQSRKMRRFELFINRGHGWKSICGFQPTARMVFSGGNDVYMEKVGCTPRVGQYGWIFSKLSWQPIPSSLSRPRFAALVDSCGTFDYVATWINRTLRKSSTTFPFACLA
jgi:hypothetical protein